VVMGPDVRRDDGDLLPTTPPDCVLSIARVDGKLPPRH
jgi:hypothetical protein